MSDGESTPPAPRRRPSYGLPAPTGPAPDPADGPATLGAPSYATPPGGAPAAHDPYRPQTGPLPVSGRPGPAPRRRRGLWPLIIGLVLLLVVGPAATIGGLVWSLGSLASDASSGPIVMEGSSAEIPVDAQQMLIVYVPAQDAAAAECTAEGTGPDQVSTVASSSPITFADGSEYEQALGVASLADTTVTITCTGTDAPAYLGPYSVFGMAAPLLIGPIIGVVAGLIGLVLTIVGIVRLVRSGRS